MVWTAPMTAVDNATFTAAQFNTHIRDNLLETMPGKATTLGGYFVSDGANAISQRFSYTANVLTSESTASTTFTDLATVGPTITNFVSGASFFIFVGAEVSGSLTTTFSLMGFDISGDMTLAPTDIYTAGSVGTGTRQLANVFRAIPLSGAGSIITIQAKYRATTGTATFANRWIGILNF